MFRILIIITIILIAIPVYNSVTEYYDKKIDKAKLMTKSATKAVKYKYGKDAERIGKNIEDFGDEIKKSSEN